MRTRSLVAGLLVVVSVGWLGVPANGDDPEIVTPGTALPASDAPIGIGCLNPVFEDQGVPIDVITDCDGNSYTVNADGSVTGGGNGPNRDPQPGPIPGPPPPPPPRRGPQPGCGRSCIAVTNDQLQSNSPRWTPILTPYPQGPPFKGVWGSVGNSLIDNRTFSYVHDAYDYAPQGRPPSDWATAFVRRTYRSRDISYHSNFGPGHFCNYDTQVAFWDVGEDPEIQETAAIVFGPSMTYAQRLGEAGGGLFTPSYQYAFGTLQLYDGSQDPIASHEQAETAVLTRKTGETYHFEVIEIDSEYFGRLTRLEDRNGYGQTVTYKTWTQQELTAAPDRQWQIDEVNADDGTTLEFTYGTSQVSGRWVIEDIDLPNGETVSYTYSGGNLTEVDHPDGTTSTFDYANIDGNDVITFFDAAADGTHRTKEVYLTDQLFGTLDDSELHIWNSATLLTRVVLNGDGEVGFFSLPVSGRTAVYEGAGRLKIMHPQNITYYQDGWELGEYDDIEGEWEIIGTQDDGVSWASDHEFYPEDFTDERGIKTFYEYDSDGWPTIKAYGDGTFEAWCYNEFKQPLRYRDREARVTYWTYDDQGNVLTRKVGLIDTTDVSGGGGGGYGYYGGVPDYNPCETENDEQVTGEYAVYEWEYYAESHANEFLLKTYTDPLGNETDYEYDASDRLKKIIEPPIRMTSRTTTRAES